ncbi:S-layer homology domain-containing protein [Leptolyngbya sp. PL-A3]|uniref:S-layer homology domain-containing protein n=1 Tax=Leptolyngbya sp. PL-A3 TaxID=2933911 RepID=UPI003299D373
MSGFSRWVAGTAALLALGLSSGVAVAPLVSPAPVTAQEFSFSDVPDDYWAKGFITELTRMGIIEGFPNGTFHPNSPVTRAQFAAMLRRANANYWERPNINRITVFSDVSSSYWAATAINSVVRTGFMRGYHDGIFNPELAIPREQVFVSLANGLGYTQALTQEPSSVLNIYQDASSISDYALRGVAAATVNGLVVNYPNVTRIAPCCYGATRAEVAAAIYQALVSTGHAPAINSPYIVTPAPAAATP